MPPTDLRIFLRLLAQADQLTRVTCRVDPHLELAAIVDQVSKSGGAARALLFEQLDGSALPVAANLYGSVARVGWALGTSDLEVPAARLSRDLALTGLAEPAAALAAVCAAPQHQPELCCKPVCRDVDHTPLGLTLLPQIRAWPGDGGCYLTLAQIVTRDLAGKAQNTGMYRVQLLDRQHAAVRCRSGSGMAAHLAEWHAAGRALPVAIALGGPPALTWAAAAPLPHGVSEAAFCSYLLGERLAMTPCEGSGLLVPATAEVVIEGEIAPGAYAQEGPFGNHTGYYEPIGPAPLLRVQRVTARHDAICPWTLVGPPPMENIHLAQASLSVLLPLLRLALPTIIAVDMPAPGIFHRAAVVALAAAECRPLAELAELLWQTALLRNARLLLLCTADVDVRDPAAVYWRTLNRVDWERDLYRCGGRLVVDLRHLPRALAVHQEAEVLARVRRRWPELGIDTTGH